MKTFARLAGMILMLVALTIISVIISLWTIRIPNGVDESEIQTIGVKTHRGFPISFHTTAPGWSYGEFNATRCTINSFTWFVALTLGASVLRWTLRKRGGSNKASEVTSLRSEPQR